MAGGDPLGVIDAEKPGSAVPRLANPGAPDGEEPGVTAETHTFPSAARSRRPHDMPFRRLAPTASGRR